jgi:hypothetical protein
MWQACGKHVANMRQPNCDKQRQTHLQRGPFAPRFTQAKAGFAGFDRVKKALNHGRMLRKMAGNAARSADALNDAIGGNDERIYCGLGYSEAVCPGQSRERTW